MNAEYLATLSLEDLNELVFTINSIITIRKNNDKLERIRTSQHTNITFDKKLYGRCHYLVKKNNDGKITMTELEELRLLQPLYTTCRWMINARPIPNLD